MSFRNKQIIYKASQNVLKGNLKRVGEEYFKDYEKPAKTYSGITGIAAVLDIICIFGALGVIGSASPYVFASWEDLDEEDWEAYGFTNNFDFSEISATSKAAAVGQFFFLVAYVVLDLSMLIWGFHLK